MNKFSLKVLFTLDLWTFLIIGTIIYFQFVTGGAFPFMLFYISLLILISLNVITVSGYLLRHLRMNLAKQK